MPERKVIHSNLDIGRHHSFGDFLEQHLGNLKDDLLRECDRIASARELLLKKQLKDADMKIAELQAKLQNMNSADGALTALERNGNDATITSLDPHDIAITTPSNLHLDEQTTVDIDNPLETPLEKTDHAFESVTLWGEWKQLLVGSSSVFGQNIDQQMEDQAAAYLRGKSDIDFRPQRELRLKLLSSRCTVSPNSKYVITWEVLGIPILFYDIVMIPLQVFHKPEGVAADLLAWGLLLYWTIDIFLRLLFFGHIRRDGSVQLERQVFLKAYLRGSFSFDFLMVAPDWFSKVVEAGGLRNVAMLRLLKILRLMRLMRMSKIKRMFRELEDTFDSEYFTVIVSLVLNLFAVLGMCHFAACFWFWLGNLDIDGEPSWVDQQIKQSSWDYQYVLSLHWAIAQFTPGASRIQPTNIVEALGAIVVLVFGLIFLALYVSALTQARARLQAMTSKVDRDNWMLRRYLRQQGVSRDLQVRAMTYVEKSVEPMFSRVQRKDVYLLPLLSRPLQLEVQEEQYFHTLIAHPLFGAIRSRSMSLTLHLFMNCILEILLAAGDVLFETGSVAHEMYFVARGALAYLHHGGQKVDFVDVGG